MPSRCGPRGSRGCPTVRNVTVPLRGPATGTQLPSIRQLAAELDVAPGTVARTLPGDSSSNGDATAPTVTQLPATAAYPTGGHGSPGRPRLRRPGQ